MASKKFRLPVAKRRKLLKQLRPVGLVLIGVLIGWLLANIASETSRPKNLVWAIDESITIPKELKDSLNRQTACKEYRGAGSPEGVGLWAVQQMYEDRFAKIAHGCSWSLDRYVVAIKNGVWFVVPPEEYFDSTKNDALPLCSVLQKYDISSDLEAFCIRPDGKAQTNPVKP